MPIDPAGGLSRAHAGAMAREMAYNDAQVAVVAARCVTLYGVFNASGRAMVKMTLVEYSDDLVLTGEVEFGGEGDVFRALFGSVSAGTEAYEARQREGTASEGSSGKETSKRGRKPRKKPKRGDA